MTQLSVVVPVFNERDNVVPLINEITAALRGRLDFEIVYVDDASKDDTLAVLTSAKAGNPELRVVRHLSQSGQSTAIRNGVKAARGPWIATLDGDGQNDPADIKRLVASLDEADICCGYRARRNDSPSRRLASRLANAYRRAILGDEIIDTGCSLKAFRAPMLKHLQYWDGMHRFLPMLASLRGARIVQIPVAHRSRMAGKSKYTNFHRLKRTLRDLRGVAWLKSRTRPFAVTDIQTSPSDKRSGQDSSEQ